MVFSSVFTDITQEPFVCKRQDVHNSANPYRNIVDWNRFIFLCFSSITLNLKIIEATGIERSDILTGLFTDTAVVGDDNNINVDQLPLDYDILEDSPYRALNKEQKDELMGFVSHTVTELRTLPCPEQFKEILPFYLIKYNGKKEQMSDEAVQLSFMDDSDIVIEEE